MPGYILNHFFGNLSCKHACCTKAMIGLFYSMPASTHMVLYRVFFPIGFGKNHGSLGHSWFRYMKSEEAFWSSRYTPQWIITISKHVNELVWVVKSSSVVLGTIFGISVWVVTTLELLWSAPPHKQKEYSSALECKCPSLLCPSVCSLP